MKITECLNIEHDVFLAQLAVLEELLRTDAPLVALGSVVKTIAAAVEQHAEIEEQRLYPAIRHAFGADFPPLAVMENEHAVINEVVRAVRAGIFSRDAVDRFVDVLSDHIAKEREILFPMAEERLPAEKLEALCEHACGCGVHAGSHA